MIIIIESKDHFDKALEEAGDKLVVVDFTATWCGPCQTIAPFFKKLSEEHTTVVFLKVDVDDAQDVAAFCDIKCMPTFHFYKNKKKVEEFSGSNQTKLEELVNNMK
ncbi:thioredoxin-like [Hypomesus transpacificus]|uniref:thioredoxin-like n=1 Tax=Hypomesus transpacificus TaxID=137520 RepID=UPI001F079B70|nr:thioredoxin-like [Hypomesus transpacificus]